MAANFDLLFANEAASILGNLARKPQDAQKLKKVRNCLGRIQMDSRYPGLHSHSYSSLSGVNGEKVWESYVENNTPSAWRVFWHYGPSDGCITIVTLSQHP